MNFIFYLKLYISTFLVFLGIDAIWLTKIAPDFYKKNIGHLMTDKPNLLAAGIFYIFFIFGILVFAVLPGLRDNSVKNTALLGALFGALTYATYDLTNLATLKDWPLKVTLVDIVWGGALISMVVSVAGYYIGQKL